MKQAVSTLILSFITLVNVWGRPEGPEFSDRYSLTFDAIDSDRIYVKARLNLEDSLLYMSPYGPMPQRWPDYIRNLSVKSSDGQALPVRKTGEATWIVSGTGRGEEVALSYEMVLEHEQIAWPGGIDGVAYRRDWGVMASGRSLFVMNGKDKKDIQVRVETPENWNVSACWLPADTDQKVYRVGNLLSLQESFVVVGTHEEANITRDGFTLKFILGGDKVKGEKSRYIQVATGVMDYYIDLMGGIPKPAPGMELKQSLVIINQSENVDGEVIGNHISMFMNPEGGPMDQMIGWFMFAHEFFHLWNGKTLRFADTTTDWFKEGISNYYTIKALTQTGFINEEIVMAMLNNLFYQRYIQDPGYGSLSPSRAASGFEKDNHWGLVYGGGLFAGIAMDMEIRHRSGNFSSLDDLMRSFYKRFGGTEQLIRQDDILREANQLGTTDFSGLLEKHIQGASPISLAPYLKFAGVSAVTEGGQLQLTHIPEKTDLQEAIWTGFLGGN
jgi:predicted metalloprotease with PDZ domain